MSDINFIFVSLFTDKFPGGYWFLLAGPLIDGAFGGIYLLTTLFRDLIASLD